MNHINTKEGSFGYSLIRNAVPFDYSFYDMEDEELYKYIKENSSNNYVFIKYMYYDLGHDEEWVEEQKRLVNYDLLKIKREIFLEWTMTGDDSVFEEEVIDNLSKNAKVKPIGKFFVRNRWKFNVYEELHNIIHRNYIISIDIASGLEQDSTVVTIIDPFTFKTAALFRSNNISTVDLVELLVALIDDYFYAGVLVPERNNMGISVIQMLLKTHVANHVYFNVNESAVKREQEQQMVGKRNKEKKKKKSSTGKRIYGIDTTPKSRKIMIEEILNTIINEEPEKINNPELLEEIKTLVRDKKGKIQARSGCHDDVVMSYLIGLYMYLYGNNVRQFIKVTYIGDNEEERHSKESLKKNAQRIKRMTNIINSDPDVVSYQMNLIDNNKEHRKINIDEEERLEYTDSNGETAHRQKIKKNINRLLDITR